MSNPLPESSRLSTVSQVRSDPHVGLSGSSHTRVSCPEIWTSDTQSRKIKEITVTKVQRQGKGETRNNKESLTIFVKYETPIIGKGRSQTTNGNTTQTGRESTPGTEIGVKGCVTPLPHSPLLILVT